LAGGTITGGLAGLLINCGGNCSGTIRNSGKIEATRSSGGGVDLNGYRSNASSWTGDFINEAGGQILGVNGASSGAFPSEAAGAFIHIPQFNGNIINRGLVKGFKWGIALGNTLPSVIFRMTGAVRNEAGGEITALAANGTALFIDANANAANFGSHVVDGGIDNAGTIRGGSGAEGAGIRLDGVRLGAALRNSGIIEATTAIDLAFAGGLTNFIQTAGLTRGNIDSNQSHAPNPSDPRPELGFADVIRFTGGRFEGNIIPDTLDQVFIGENGGASNRTVAFVSGVTQGLSSLTIQSGIALLGTTAKGVNGAGYFFNGLGTLNVAGGAELYLDDDTRINANTVNLAAGSTLNYFLTTDTTKNGKIFSAVNANIRTANLKITLDPVTFAQTVGRQFVFTKLIDSPNLDGPFATVSLDGAGSTFRVAQTFVPNNSSITLTITRFALTELPNLTRPSRPVADVLEDIISGGGPIGPDLEEALDSILAAPNPTDSVRWLEELSGARAAEVLASSRRTDDPFKSLVSDRVAAVKATGCKVAGFMWCEPRYASVSPEKQSDADDPFGWITKGVRQSGKTSAWGRAIGSWSDRNAGNTVRLLGGIAGADFVVDAETLIGAAFQFTDSHSDLGGADDFGDVQSYQFGGYGSWGDTNFFVNANLSGIWHKFDSSRSITIGGRRRIAKADYDGQAVSAALEAGTVIEADGVRFQPLASLSFVRQWTEDYRETGAGGLSLDVKGRETDSLRSSIGGRAAFPVAMGSSKAIVEGRAAWVHEFLDTQTSFSASFVDAPGARFITTSEKAPRDQAVVGAGIVVPVADNANLFVDYDASLSRDAITHTGAVGLRVTW
jgi:subtilase-type serine protease